VHFLLSVFATKCVLVFFLFCRIVFVSAPADIAVLMIVE
jgi:hypothetical protein